MQNKKITIETKNNLPEEIRIKELLEAVLEKYSCPIFTDKVVIEKLDYCFSHPVLTLGTEWIEKIGGKAIFVYTYRIFVHEQFHWFVTSNKKYRKCIEYLKSHYQDLGDCNIDGKHPDSFWEHLIVYWNYYKFLKGNLSETEFSIKIKDTHLKTRCCVRENFEQMRVGLEKFDMVYKGVSE
jgi:hypothetical protein